MRKVIDKNYFDDEKLCHFLRSRENKAVITDYAAMESYTGDAKGNIIDSMKILMYFPSQVIILKSTGQIVSLKSNSNGIVKRMIDQRQTKGFKKFCLALNRIGRINKQSRDVFQHGKAAEQQLAKMLKDACYIKSGFLKLKKEYTKEEKRILTKGLPLTPKMCKKICEDVGDIAYFNLQSLPNPPSFKTKHEFFDSFIFRISLCMYASALNWLAIGGFESRKLKDIRNDLIDINYATYATYFDGFLTNDKKALQTYLLAKTLMETLPRK